MKKLSYLMVLVAVLGFILLVWGNSVKAVRAAVELEMCVSHDSETETYIFSLAEYDGKLYAGTYPNAKIYVYDGTSWAEAYSITGETHVWSLAVYDGKLYAGTEPGGKVYAYDGISWELSFDSPEWLISSLAVYDGQLYAGTWSHGRIYVYDGSDWTLAFDVFTLLSTDVQYPTYVAHVFALAEYDGKLYAGTDVLPNVTGLDPDQPGGLIYVYDGTTWSLAEDTDQAQIRSLAVYDGKLYAGTGWNGVIYDYDSNTNSWDLAYDSPTNSVLSLAVHSGNLYAGTSTPGDIYGFDGSEWTIAFDSPEAGVLSLATYAGNFYAGNFYAGTSKNGRIYGPCLLIVDIDVKPGSYPNSINLSDQGLLPVAILGSDSFDVTTIDPDTIELGGIDLATRGSAKAPKLAYSCEDVNEDGYMDLMAFFEVQALVDVGALTEKTTELTLTADLYDGTPIEGTDSVNIVP